MKLEDFLARVVPAGGNHLIIAYNRKPGGKPDPRAWSSRTFGATDYAGAAGFVRWCVRHGFDTYYALAAFNLASVQTNTKTQEQYTTARREQSNVHSMRVLALDADVARPGDGKDPKKVFTDRRAALKWLLDFTQAASLPMPNLAVNSGYGIHFYWVLEDALTLSAWQPLADALKCAMLAHGWTGDTSITIDAARILRPPETNNLKDVNNPAPVEVMAKFNAGEYPVGMITQALAPWMNVAQSQSQHQATGTHAHTHTASVSTLGARPAHVGAPPNPQNANAAAGNSRRDYSFARIATHCVQVAQSLAAQGAGDSRELWYLGHLTLAAHCHDGRSFAHEISKGDPRYTQKETEDEFNLALGETASKSVGAPRCATYDGYRRGVCNTCPWQGKLNSPYSLGIEDGDFPDHWRRTSNHWLERFDHKAKEWLPVIEGDFYAPLLDRLPTGGFALSFTYEDTARRTNHVRVTGIEAIKPHEIGALVAGQGITVNRQNAPYVGDFVAAWINKLRSLKTERTDLVRPFGWAFSLGGERIGASVAGKLYRADKTVDIIPGGDGEVRLKFTPMGEFQHWRAAAKLFEHGRTDIQALIATSFGAPLMAFTGVRGLVFNFWSKESGVGKTSAIKVANAVWGSPSSMQSNADTPNAVIHLLSETRFVPKFWDELRVKPTWQGEFVDMLFVVPQGKERARMAPDTTLRPVGEWDTLLVFTANRSIMDYILAESGGTDAGVARAFECFLPKYKMPYSATAGQVIARVETNFGHAGVEYIAYMAANIAQVAAAVSQTMAQFESTLKPDNVERYYIAGMSACLVGAAIARKLNLFDFEIQKLHDYLVTVFHGLRRVRPGQTLVAQQGGYDLEQILAQFSSAHADQRIITETLGRQGPTKVRVLFAPRVHQVVIQVANVPQIMRVDRKTLVDWLHRQNLPARAMIEQMITDWGASEHRQTLGGGTPYAGGQMFVLDIPLAQGALGSYLHDTSKSTGAPGMRASPGASLAGNQPTI